RRRVRRLEAFLRPGAAALHEPRPQRHRRAADADRLEPGACRRPPAPRLIDKPPLHQLAPSPRYPEASANRVPSPATPLHPPLPTRQAVMQRSRESRDPLRILLDRLIGGPRLAPGSGLAL